ncbi:MAG: type II pantothenate kinase [Clostridia bacterium]
MSIIVGIDVGGSTTKIVGFNIAGETKALMSPVWVKATDPLASIYGAFGKFANVNKITLSEIDRIMITGVGSTYIGDKIFDIKTVHVEEFMSIGKGGLYLSGLEKAVIASMGTGTAIVYAENGKKTEYLGGTGIGGGTLIGLSKRAIRMENVDQISELADEGDLSNIDLKIKDMTKKNIIPTLPTEATAANFGKVSDIATNADYALGIINLVFETVGMLGVFAAREKKIGDIILTGNLTTIKQGKRLFDGMGKMFGVNFVIPENAKYSTVIGAALTYFD